MSLKLIVLKLLPGINKYRFQWVNFYKRFFYFLRNLPGKSDLFGPPRGLYKDSLSFPKPSGIKVVILSERFSLTRKLPNTQSIKVKEKFENHQEAHINRKSCFFLEGARYYSGDGGFVITKDDKLLKPCSPSRNEWAEERHHAFYRLKLPNTTYLSKVVLIDSKEADSNFGHWFMDLLPRFLYLNELEIDFQDYILCLNVGTMDFHTESLDHLKDMGFNFKAILPVRNLNFCADELIIPPYCTKDGLNQNYWARSTAEINFIKKLIPGENVPDGPEKIYISRRKSIRSFEQEKKIIDFLQESGYAEVFLEDLSLIEQAKLFYNATHIVGLHGSGFSNLFHCRPQTKILEIFNANFIVTDFWSISNILDLDYHAYCDDCFWKAGVPYRLARNTPTEINIESLIVYLGNNDFL